MHMCKLYNLLISEICSVKECNQSANLLNLWRNIPHLSSLLLDLSEIHANIIKHGYAYIRVVKRNPYNTRRPTLLLIIMQRRC